ncbi:hypothetical protein ACGF12_36895 [Kitasatospora sp. NPDC048296]|uniref:hypothetical protein n=1 Tax=Kitasatospora sp. NPDC048296 TaxID=3364048 RepID=UPI003718F5C5
MPDLFEDGEPLYWADNEDDVKVLGLYTTRALAEARIEHYRELPGFRESPGGFAVHPYPLDQRRWLRGFQAPPGS